MKIIFKDIIGRRINLIKLNLTYLDDFTFANRTLELRQIYLEPTLDLLNKLEVSVSGEITLD